MWVFVKVVCENTISALWVKLSLSRFQNPIEPPFNPWTPNKNLEKQPPEPLRIFYKFSSASVWAAQKFGTMSIIYKVLTLQGKFLLIWNPLLIPLPIAKRILGITQKSFRKIWTLTNFALVADSLLVTWPSDKKNVTIATCRWRFITKFAVWIAEALIDLTSFWIGLVAQVVMSDNQLCRKKAFSMWPSEIAKSSCQLSMVRLLPNFQGS